MDVGLREVRAGELVYIRGVEGLGYAQWGGLPQLLHYTLLQQRVRWFVHEAGEEGATSSRIVELLGDMPAP